MAATHSRSFIQRTDKVLTFTPIDWGQTFESAGCRTQATLAVLIRSPDVLTSGPGAGFVCCYQQRMRLKPECACGNARIDPGVLPPSGFVAAVVQGAMVSSTQGNGVFIADFASKGPALGKSKVVCI